MGEAFLMRRGGSGRVAVGSCAMLCVKFPAGSSCVCEKDQRRLSAGNAPGLAAFAIPEAGTWTVTISDGTNQKSRNVTFAAGDAEVLTLSYTPDQLVILAQPDGFTSGYSWQGSASYGDYQGHGNMLVAGMGYVSPAIDLTDYSTVSFTGFVDYMLIPDDSRLFLDPDCTKYLDRDADFARSVDVDFSNHEEETFTFDVSALSGLHYFGFADSGADFAFKSITVS